MRIRTTLFLAFLFATLVPSVIFAWWAYSHGVQREFSEVKDRHLLLAQNLSAALERYHIDVTATFESISQSLLEGRVPANLASLMQSINLECVAIVDEKTGKVINQANMAGLQEMENFPPEYLNAARQIATSNSVTFSNVLAGENGKNVLVATRKFGEILSIAVINTEYFVELGRSISFGKRGHAAIVDADGNILAHPLPSWIAERKNISKVSAVQRMMNGETGIERFYSPALKGDMIAGLTSVPGPGWGVMIPQPISELYDKVYENNQAIIAVLALAIVLTLGMVLFFIGSLATPLENILETMRVNAKTRTLNRSSSGSRFFRIAEVEHLNRHYNTMVRRVSAATEEVRALAYADTVTGLPNRMGLHELGQKTIDVCVENDDEGIVVFIDLDDFKEINDVHGHGVGDDFLAACADRLISALEPWCQHPINEANGPVVARIGGDEFAIVVPGPCSGAEVRACLSALRSAMSTSGPQFTFVSQTGASMGCARFPKDGVSLTELLKRADIAMYKAKNTGKNRVEIYTSQIGIMTASEIRHGIEIAIEENQLVLEYQPKVCASSRQVNGVEALVRWEHPTCGRMPPMQWIPAITRTPLMIKLGEWVVRQAMADYAKWYEAGLDLPVAVNIDAEHFAQPGFTRWLTKTAGEHKFAPEKLQIEVTEDTLFSTTSHPARVLEELHAAGFKVAIDDFGTGYSNIARMSQLPFDCLKVDRSVVSNAQTNIRIGKLLNCIVMMAKELDCSIVAEGVETEIQATFIRNLEIDTLQGFLFSAALPASDVGDWVMRHDKRQKTVSRMTGTASRSGSDKTLELN